MTRERYYEARARGELPDDFPWDPPKVYDTSWGELFWVPLERCRAYCAEEGITSLEEYATHRRAGRLPQDFPPNPRNAYNVPLEYLGWRRTDVRLGKRTAENVVRRIFEGMLGQPFPTCRPKWLTYGGNRLELDGFSRVLGVAFEYQGEYHFQIVEAHQRSRTLDEVQRADAFKVDKCRACGIDLIVVPFDVDDKEDFIASRVVTLGKRFLRDLVGHFFENRDKIIREQIERERQAWKNSRRRIEFELSDRRLSKILQLYNQRGYEEAKLALRTTLKGARAADQRGAELPASQSKSSWEELRLLEYLNHLQQEGRSTERIFIRPVGRYAAGLKRKVREGGS